LVEQEDAARAGRDIFKSALGMAENADETFGRDGRAEGESAQGRENLRAVNVRLIERLTESAEAGENDDRLHEVGDGRFVIGGGFERELTRAVGFNEEGDAAFFASIV
jgi:hypothetical protein